MSKPRRIAILSVHTCPLATLGGKKTGGMNVYVRELSRELGKQGVAVDIFVLMRDSCTPHIDDSTLGQSARVIHISAGSDSSPDQTTIYPHLPKFVEGVQAFARQEGLHYDLIHSHYWLSGWVALKLREAWNIPFVQMFHTLGHMKNRVADSAEGMEQIQRVPVETELIREADAIVAATAAERIQLMWLYKADMRKISIVPPGVNTARFQPLPSDEAHREIGISPDQELLLFVGRIEPLKGIETLLRAVARLDENHHHSLCVAIIGGDPNGADQDDNVELARLQNLRTELGISEVVTFLGSRDQARLQYYYSAAQALVMPSHYESFGLVALEAMACGTPVIASEVGGLAYLVQDGITGFHVPDRDPEELAGKINLLLDNPALRAEMSQAAVAHAQQYDWSNIADQVLAIYESLLT